MKNFFSKIKNGIKKVLTNIKKVFVSLKDKIKNVFNRIRNKNRENQESSGINNDQVISNQNTNTISSERQTIVKDNTIPMNSDTKFRTTGHDTIVAPIVMNKIQNNNIPDRDVDNGINQDNESHSEEVENTINNENAERVVSIEIKESKGIVEFETTTGKKYQKNIEDILSERNNVYQHWNINKKCNDFAKNKIQALRLRRKLNPVVISTLNNEEDIDNYIKCVNNTERIWFNLEHDLINSKLKGKNARVMKRAGKQEEKIGAKVKRKEGLIERMLKKIRAKNKEPEEMAEEIEVIEKDNNELNGIEEEIVEEISEIEDKKSKKAEKLAKKEEEKLAKKEFKERYISYVALIGKLYGLKPRKKLDEIMGNVVDRDIYNLTDKDAWTRAVATFNVGHRLSMIQPREAKKYLTSAYDQLINEELLTKNENAFQYLEDTLLNLQELYIREGDFKEASRFNIEYMRIVEREKKEKFGPMLLEYKKNGSKIKEIDVMIEYRKKYVAGQKVAMKILYGEGHKFEAEELYRKVLHESGIVLTDEAYDLSMQENGIENGKYIVIANGITYREPILGNEKYLSLRNKLTQELLKDKIHNGMNEEPKLEPKTETINTEPKLEPKTETVTTEPKLEPKTETVTTEPKLEPKTETVTTEPKVEPKTETVTTEPKLEPKTETVTTEPKVEPKTETVTTEPKVEPKTETVTTEPKVESKTEAGVKEQNLEEHVAQVEISDTKKKGIIARTKEAIDNIAKERAEKVREKKAREDLIRKQKEEQNKREEEEKKRLEEEKKKAEEEQRKLEEKKKAELAEFNKRYNNYHILARGIIGGPAKKDIQEIRNDVIHNDIYNMTSDDDAIKGVATFRVGHRLATLPAKKKEAERLLKTATSILSNDDILSKDDSLIGVLQNAHIDLGNLYLMNDDFVNAEKSFVDYMETVRKEKVEKYDPKILEAKKSGKVIDEIDLWIEVKSKFATGKKSMIKLLSKSGRTGEAEELYRRLLEDCKIALSDEEYQLSVDSNCIENGRYMRITNGRTYSEPILGNEYLLLRRRNISNKALSER